LIGEDVPGNRIDHGPANSQGGIVCTDAEGKAKRIIQRLVNEVGGDRGQPDQHRRPWLRGYRDADERSVDRDIKGSEFDARDRAPRSDRFGVAPEAQA
jgi:hypothetical protein